MRSTLTTRLGLEVSVRKMRDVAKTERRVRMDRRACVMLASVLHHVAGEVLQRSAEVAHHSKRQRITPSHLNCGIQQDSTLATLFKSTHIAGGGFNAPAVEHPKPTRKRKPKGKKSTTTTTTTTTKKRKVVTKPRKTTKTSKEPSEASLVTTEAEVAAVNEVTVPAAPSPKEDTHNEAPNTVDHALQGSMPEVHPEVPEVPAVEALYVEVSPGVGMAVHPEVAAAVPEIPEAVYAEVSPGVGMAVYPEMS